MATERRKKKAQKSSELASNKGKPLPTRNIDTDGIELVFGLVGPTGVDLTMVCDELRVQLKAMQYEPIVISLSELIPLYLRTPSIGFENEYIRIKKLMELGTDLREQTKQSDIVGRLGIARLRTIREERSGDARKPLSRVAYIIRSFKRPEEVQLFRETYGKAFTLISVYSPRPARIKHMAKKFATMKIPGRSAEELAVELINNDYAEEGKKLGQSVGETFPLADYFVTSESRHEVEKHLRRLIRLTFGDPYISPTRDEQGMFFAQASALRSLDLSRQVGAAVISSDGDLLSTGCNEVPKFGGGLYWGEDSYRVRDVELGFDSNVFVKKEIVEDAFARLREAGWLSDSAKEFSDGQLAEDSLFGNEAFIRSSKLFDVIEFGRAVHAEMAAITQAARNGTALENGRLFCTTFPCHICSRHIISSGIREVIFIEPYEKSRTKDLYDDSISVEPYEASTKRANFKAFVGVAPRKYMDLFSMPSSRKNRSGKILDADEIANNPRIKRIVLTYLSIEDIVINETEPLPPTQGDHHGR